MPSTATKLYDTGGEIVAKKMFGEYGIYANGKIFGLICDNKLFIKPTNSGREFIGDLVESPAYPGAKPSFLIEEKIEDSEWLSKLVKISLKELPEANLTSGSGNVSIDFTSDNFEEFAEKQ